jgi:redox-sensitive bicupin YhaK (pirin superfamily)
VQFALSEYEPVLPGESPSDQFEVEHILPQATTADWSRIFNEGEHLRWIHTWANLIPLTQRMNPSIGQSQYAQKRHEYQGSIFASARQIAEQYANWDVQALADRADKIATWALARWASATSG